MNEVDENLPQALTSEWSPRSLFFFSGSLKKRTGGVAR